MSAPPVHVLGIFVGGRGTRMREGGAVKGLLATEDGAPIVAKLRAACAAARGEIALVGRPASRRPYTEDASLGLGGATELDDDPGAEGPLGGLLALLRYAASRAPHARAVALACDMPAVDAGLVAKLLAAPSTAPVVAPRGARGWEPFFARYEAARVLTVAEALAARGERRLQRILDAAGAEELILTPSEADQLVDWDTPEDLPGAVRAATRATDGEGT